jgi:hypothetical protein
VTNTTLPEPPVPAGVDLQDFAFMPLDVQRLRDSDLASDETPEACWAAVLLWCASWHQVPAGSIPDSDQWLAKQAGYVSRGKIDPAWAKSVRPGALRGWVLCSDGRLYHPVVCEKAMAAWRSKLEQRWKTECARIKKHAQRHEMSLPLPELDDWIAQGCPQGLPLPVPGDVAGVSHGQSSGQGGGVPRETASKREGEGQGQRELKEKEERASSGPPFPRALADGRGTLAEQAAEGMRLAGLPNVAPEDPELLAVLGQGITVAELIAAATYAKARRKGNAYAYARALGKRKDAAELAAESVGPPPVVVEPGETAAQYLARMEAEREAERNRPRATVDTAALRANARKAIGHNPTKGNAA